MLSLSAGTKAPLLDTFDEQGNSVSIPSTDWSFIWFNPQFKRFGCQSCQTSLLHNLYPEFRILGCRVYGATFDSPEINAQRNEPHVWRIPLVQVGKQEAEMWGALREVGDSWAKYTPAPVSYIVSPSGIVSQAYENPDPKIHASHVLQDLKALIQEPETLRSVHPL